MNRFIALNSPDRLRDTAAVLNQDILMVAKVMTYIWRRGFSPVKPRLKPRFHEYVSIHMKSLIEAQHIVLLYKFLKVALETLLFASMFNLLVIVCMRKT